MLQEKFYQKIISLRRLDYISLKTDIFNVLVNKSEDNYIKISVEYNYVSDCSDSTHDDDLPGTLAVDENKNAVFYELFREEDLEKVQMSASFLKANIFIEVPENIIIDIQTMQSNVTVENRVAEFNISSLDGSVSFENAGNGYINTANGSIKLSNVTDNFDVKSANGEITVESGIGGVLNVFSENGFIEIFDTDFNRVSCKSKNSDIRAELSQGSADLFEIVSEHGSIHFSIDNYYCESISLSSVHGGLKILTPKYININLDLRTENGNIKSRVDTENAYEAIIDSNQFLLKFDENTTNITGFTKNGNIRIKEFEGVLPKAFHREQKKAEQRFEYVSENEVIDNAVDMTDDINEPLDEAMDIIDVDVPVDNAKYKIQKMMNKVKNQINKENFEDIYEKTKTNISDVTDKLKNAIPRIKIKPAKKTKPENESNENIIKILTMVENKSITVDEAAKMLNPFIKNTDHTE